ncbi:hypothetical protein XENOCAPTIV_019928, partial [Xenoophorus captivus]
KLTDIRRNVTKSSPSRLQPSYNTTFQKILFSTLHFPVFYQNIPSSSSWFLSGGRPMSIDVVLGVCFLRRGPDCVLSVFLGRAGAAIWRGPTVPPAVGFAQWQVSAVPLTVALQQSRNRLGGKESAQHRKREADESSRSE